MKIKHNISGIKISSVIKNVNIGEDIFISDNLDIRSGSVLLVSIVEINHKYSSIELQSGRVVPLNKHDKVICVIGSRMASDGMCGIVPDNALSVGSEIAVLNLGGVIGKQIAYNRIIGSPTYCKIIGQVISDDGKPLNIEDYAIISMDKKIKITKPVIGYLGTSMNSGKTTVMSNVINIMKNNNINVAAIKATGVATQRDLYNFIDHGAKVANSFLDCGLLSTCNISSDVVAESTKGLINNSGNIDGIDIVFVEFGDSIYGKYNVMEILSDADIKSCFSGFVLCCYDIPGSLQLYNNVKDMQLNPIMLSGPVTNNIYTLSHALKTFNVDIPLFDNMNNVNLNTDALQPIVDLIAL